MRVNLIDSRALAVAVCQPGTDQWYNWTTYAFESPFNAAKHLLPLVPVEPAGSAVNQLVTADIGTSHLKIPDCVALVFTVSPVAIVDPGTLVYPIPAARTWGWPF